MTLCDAGGNWLESIVIPANTGERAGALLLFEKVKAASWSQDITLIWADEGFAGAESTLKRRCKKSLVGSWTLESRNQDKKASACSVSDG